MVRSVRPLVTSLIAVMALTGCFSGEPKVAEISQVSAEQAQAMAAAESGESEGSGAEGGPPVFVAVDIDYESAPATLPAGGASITIDNQGAAEHNVVFESLGEEPVVTADPGETASGEVNLEAGEQVYYCSIPGHRGAGMEGTLEVQ